jgi:bacterial surface protein 26-residue repeat/bacterial surface protein 26-residue repeat/bacterial surface protein 26-residue repeat/bacterial surface protein 26-residue repeat
MGEMFNECQNLTSLNLSSFNTTNVTCMANMFRGCSSLKSLDLSNFNTAKVGFMDNMFDGCISLTTLNISSFNTKEVIHMRSMFRNCKKLTSLDLTNFNTKGTVSFSEMFSHCESLTTIYCNDAWNCSTAKDMFSFCEKLKGAVAYDKNKTDGSMANPDTGYFTRKTPSGISAGMSSNNATVRTIYSVNGKKQKELQRGVNIVRMIDGTIRKVIK